jgi:hypothetical protein
MNLRNKLSRVFARSNSPLAFLALMVVAFLFPSPAQAQFRGSLSGTITDPNGGAVVGATVTLTNTTTNEKLTSTTSSYGLYQFNALPPAPYRLTVEKSGFETKVLDNVQIVPEQPNSLDVQLQLGQVTQSITVSGTTYALDTDTANISGTVTNKDVQYLPSFGRDVFQLVQLAPGVFGDGAQAVGGAANLPGTQGPGGTGGSAGIFQTENGPQVVAAGQQNEDNGYLIDGISTTSAVWGGTTVITPSEDSIQSVKVLSNGYDAEYGRFGGAQVQVISKSGTNQVHGSLFFTAHRPGLNAYQPYNGDGNADLRDSDFFDQLGGSVGGPIWKNKIFAFFDYETVRSPQAQTTISNQWGDTSAFDGLAPSGSISSKYLTFPGSAIVNRGINNSSCTDAGLQEYNASTGTGNCITVPGQGLDVGSPLTTGLGTQDPGWTSASNPGVGGGLNPANPVADIANFITASTTTYSKAQYNGRLDADVTANDHATFAIYWVPQSDSFLNGPAREYNYFHHSQVNDSLSGIWNHIFSPTLLNEFRVNAAGWRWNEVADNPQSPIGLPTDDIDTIGSINLASFGPNVGSILNQWTYSYKDVATKVVGRHTIKFGGDLTRLFYLQDCAGCGVPSYHFFNLWDFLNDAPQEESSGFNPTTGFPTTERQDQREDIWGFFVQDDFKLRRNLTINAGLRWSYFGPLSSKEGNMFAAFPGAGADYLTGLAVRPAHSWNAQKDNFGPQIGFAWSPDMFHDKLVLRGGYGLDYNEEEIAISANISNNPGVVVFPSFVMSTPSSPNPGIIYAVSSGIHNLYGYPANPNAISPFGANGLPTTGSVGVEIFPRDLPTMRTHHYSFEGEYDLGHDTIATLGYQGSLSRDIFFHENPNAAPAAEGLTLNPQIGGGDYWGVSGWGNYNAMLAELNHKFSQQFSAQAQFVWSKSMDTSSGPYFEQPYPYNLNLDYGPSDYNVGKDFKLFGVWQPMIFHGENAWMEKIFGGWSVSGDFNIHSGFPWSPLVDVSSGSLYCGTCGYSELFPAAFIAKPGSNTSNDAFKTVADSNFPNGGAAYFATPTYTAYSGSTYGSILPQAPGVHRNSLLGPGYKAVDAELAKAFGLPRLPVLGENAKIDFRVDAYNLFNNLDFNPGSISNVITSANFGTMTGAYAGRIVTLGAHFDF